MGGILAAADIAGFLENASEFYGRSDEEGSHWFEFILAWSEKFGSVTVGVQDLYTLASANDLLMQVLGDQGERSQKIRLGRALGTKSEQVIAGFRVEPVEEDHAKRKRYRLQPVPGPAAEVGAPTHMSSSHLQATSAPETCGNSSTFCENADVADVDPIAAKNAHGAPNGGGAPSSDGASFNELRGTSATSAPSQKTSENKGKFGAEVAADQPQKLETTALDPDEEELA